MSNRKINDPVDPFNEITDNLNLNKPLVGGDDDIWGDLLNENADILDAVITDLILKAVFTDNVSIVGEGTPTDPLTVGRIDCGAYTRLLGHEWQAASLTDEHRISRILSLRKGPR